MLKKRLAELVSFYGDDRDVLDLIGSAVRSCWRYVEAVCELELVLLTAKLTMESNEYREVISSLDKKRSLAHNSLMSEVGILNRLCVKAGKEPIFEGIVEDRVSVADFAKDLVTEIFESRRL